LNRISHADHGPFYCGGQCAAISQYKFWVEDSAGQYVGAQFDAPGLGPLFCINDVWDLEGQPAGEHLVKLHFDGRDQVRISGTIENAGVVFVTFNLRYQRNIPLGNLRATKWDDATGECFRVDLFYNVAKVHDLFD
jgi:hypothetical protein